MIRVQSFDSDNIIPILSGLVCDKSTGDSYVFINTMLKMLPPSEAIQEMYLILSSLDRLYEIFSMTKLVPAINKDSLMEIINNNIYEEIKENNRAGFQEYARQVCQIELDFSNEETIGVVSSSLIAKVEYLIDQAKELDYTLEQSVSEIANFQTKYVHALTREAGNILSMLSNSDFKQLRFHFWGWTYFLNRHKIYSIESIDTFLNLISDTIRMKRNWSLMRSGPLSSLDTVLQYKDRYIENSVPLMVTPFEEFDLLVKLVGEQITVLVAPKGSGKTTWAGMIAGIGLAQGKRVQFYCPEMAPYKLLYECVLPAYVRAKYGFPVTAGQCLGLEEPYEAGSEYTVEEKKLIIKMAIEELVSDKNFYHVDTYYYHDSLSSDMRAHVKSFNPDLLIFDHTQEILGEAGYNEKTALLGTTVKGIVKEFPLHAILLSHPGSGFKTPTQENPILNEQKIAAWSNIIEAVADNIIGAVKQGKDEFKMFFTKLRFGTIPPMFTVFRMIKAHGWFEFRKEDQYIQSVNTSKAIEDMLNGVPIMIGDDDGFPREEED